MNIILLGYRGSGKTSVGKRLADLVEMSFVDGDDATRDRFDGMTIADIWDRYGEGEFRKREAEAVAALCHGDNQVIALGGGAVMTPAARLAIEAADAVRVYLKADARTLHARIHGDELTASQRPQLTNLGGGIDEIAQVLAQREPTYTDVADVVIDVARLSIDQAAEAIAEQVGGD